MFSMERAATKSWIERQLAYDEVKRLLVRLVQFPSPQTGRFEAEPQVLRLIREVVLPELQAAGVRGEIDQMGNLVAHLKGAGARASLMLVGYAMNAAPSTMPNPYSGAIVDGEAYGAPGECVWGRGACEQKGSLAAMLAALKLVVGRSDELAGDLTLVVSTAGETGRHDSLAHVVENDRVKADWAIVDGPPEIQVGNKGRVDILVTVKGKQGHSSRPWEGLNAIEGAVRVLEKLRAMMPHPAQRAHPELGRVTLTPTAIESFPKATHTIQSECRILFDRRLLPGDDPEQAVAEIKGIIGDTEPFEVKVEARDFMYPSEVSTQAGVVRVLGEAIRVMLEKEPAYSYSTAANDTGFLNIKGIEAVNYGSRDVRFQHTDHDLVSIKNVYEAAKIFALLALCR